MDQPLPPGLYIVATPIGNLGDLSHRAGAVLCGVAAVACEDTRVTGKLMQHLGVKQRLLRYDDHASEETRDYLLALASEQAVALVSDAGTPLVSDPGYKLVRAARERGIAVTAVPGPSAPIMALTLSGLPSDRFLFAGFLPAKDKARGEVLDELGAVKTTLVFFETAPRLLASLAAISERLPGREVAVARELSKLFEECRSGSAGDVIAHFTKHPPKGEIVLLIGPPPERETSGDDADALLAEALRSMKPSMAAAEVARVTGIDRRSLYRKALAMK